MSDEDKIGKITRSLSEFRRGLFRIRQKAEDERDSDAAYQRLRRWKDRTIQFLKEQVSEKEAKHLQNFVWGVSKGDFLGDLKEEITSYDRFLKTLIEDIEGHPQETLQAARSSANQEISLDSKPKESSNEVASPELRAPESFPQAILRIVWAWKPFWRNLLLVFGGALFITFIVWNALPEKTRTLLITKVWPIPLSESNVNGNRMDEPDGEHKDSSKKTVFNTNREMKNSNTGVGDPLRVQPEVDGQREIYVFLRNADGFLKENNYKAASRECDRALRLQPNNREALKKKVLIEDIIEILEKSN